MLLRLTAKNLLDENIPSRGCSLFPSCESMNMHLFVLALLTLATPQAPSDASPSKAAPSATTSPTRTAADAKTEAALKEAHAVVAAHADEVRRCFPKGETASAEDAVVVLQWGVDEKGTPKIEPAAGSLRPAEKCVCYLLGTWRFPPGDQTFRQSFFADPAQTRASPTTQPKPVILGSIDPEIIRSIVREHADSIRYCYEKELARTPGIFGKIVMKWVIKADGTVESATTAESQMNNQGVESCLATRILRWEFPKPKGGGIVIVNYPFVFKVAPPAPTPASPPASTDPSAPKVSPSKAPPSTL